MRDSLPIVRRDWTDDGDEVLHLQSPLPAERKPQIPSRLHDTAALEVVEIADLVGTQLTVTDRGLEKYSSGGGDPALVYRYEGRLYIADGHHRIVAEHLRGETSTEALVVDVPRQRNPKAPKKIKLSESVLSAFETEVYELAADPEAYGLDEEEARAYALLTQYVSPTGYLIVPDGAGDGSVIRSLLTQLSNSFDDQAEYKEGPDPVFARRVASSLATLSINLARACAANREATQARNPVYRERLPGGLSAGRRPSDFGTASLERGTEVELEHTARDPRHLVKQKRSAKLIAGAGS